MKPKANPHNLTDDEIAFLRSTNLAPEVKVYLSRQHENIGTKVTAYRKIAAAAAAEADALLAVRDLAAVHGELANLAEAKERLAAAEKAIKQLEGQVNGRDAKIRALTAKSAMAEHSND